MGSAAATRKPRVCQPKNSQNVIQERQERSSRTPTTPKPNSWPWLPSHSSLWRIPSSSPSAFPGMEFKLPAVAPAKRRRRSPKADYVAFPLLSALFSQEFGLLGSLGQSVGFRARFQRRLCPSVAIPGFICEVLVNSHLPAAPASNIPTFPPIYCGFRCSPEDKGSQLSWREGIGTWKKG